MKKLWAASSLFIPYALHLRDFLFVKLEAGCVCTRTEGINVVVVVTILIELALTVM